MQVHAYAERRLSHARRTSGAARGSPRACLREPRTMRLGGGNLYADQVRVRWGVHRVRAYIINI